MDCSTHSLLHAQQDALTHNKSTEVLWQVCSKKVDKAELRVNAVFVEVNLHCELLNSA
jgi:hypothetical protein